MIETKTAAQGTWKSTFWPNFALTNYLNLLYIFIIIAKAFLS